MMRKTTMKLKMTRMRMTNKDTQKAQFDSRRQKEKKEQEFKHNEEALNKDGKGKKNYPEEPGMKLQQFLAHAGITSRRKAVEIIEQRRVTVNGKVVTDVTARVNGAKDHIKFDGSLVHVEKQVYIVMNKPEGCITAITDNEGRKTVVDIIKPYIKARVYPVGRLDFNTTGTLILTNDGDFANKVMHPKFEIDKRYTAKIKGRISTTGLRKLVTGVRIEEGRVVKAVNAGVFKRNDQNDIVFIIIREGMNHQVKRMLQVVGASVVRLRRESVGMITDKGLAPGEWRYLTQSEVKYLTRG
jgi:23S rRNA pseudouridine2605 synthase